MEEYLGEEFEIHETDEENSESNRESKAELNDVLRKGEDNV